MIVTNKVDIPASMSAAVTTDNITTLNMGMYSYAILSQYNYQPQCLKILANEDETKLKYYSETHKNVTTTIVCLLKHKR
jgi:hypothetical protein